MEVFIFPFIPFPSMYRGSSNVIVLFLIALLCWLITSFFDVAIIILGRVYQSETR